MKKMKHLFALSLAMAMFTAQVQAQPEPYYEDSSAAYSDGEQASYMSALIPLGALAIAAILIATTDNHHHSSSKHHHGSSSSSCSHYHSHI